jgi:para-nitrobenzyl esterase
LQSMPWKDFYAIAMRAQQSIERQGGPGGTMRAFVPVVDGSFLPQHPYDPIAAPTAAHVPMIISSVENEQSPSWTDSSLESITLEEVIEKLKVRAGFMGHGYGDKTREIVESYVKSFPGRKPVEIWSLVSSNRQSVVALADAKSKQPAPVYVDWFTWQPPLFDNRMRAFHTLDICFWFYNTDVMLTHTGGGRRPRALSTKMAGALLQFMKTGNPNGGGLPNWPRYSSDRGETMILDDTCAAENDPDRQARQALPELT